MNGKNEYPGKKQKNVFLQSLKLYVMEKLIETLKSGGTILYPTDTIWGIGCDATNAEAINKIFEIENL